MVVVEGMLAFQHKANTYSRTQRRAEKTKRGRKRDSNTNLMDVSVLFYFIFFYFFFSWFFFVYNAVTTATWFVQRASMLCVKKA